MRQSGLTMKKIKSIKRHRAIWADLLTTFLLALTVAASLSAEVPRQIPVQGRLTDSTGGPVADGSYDMTFRLYHDSVGGVFVWNSGSRSVTVTKGLFTYHLGSNVALLPSLLAGDSAMWLGIKVDSDPEMTPRMKLNSGSYAYHAQSADSVSSSRYFEVAGDTIRGTVFFDQGNDGLHEARIVVANGNADLYLMQDNNQKVQLAVVDDPAGEYGSLELNDADGTVGARLRASPAEGSSLLFFKENGNYAGAFVGGTTTEGGSFELTDGGGVNVIRLDADASGDPSAQLPEGSISSYEIVDNSLSQADLGTNSVGSDEIADGAIQNSDIQINAVTLAKMAQNSVNSGKVIDGSLQTIDLSASAVPAVGYTTISGSSSSSAPETVDDFTVTVPGAGMLVVTVTGGYFFDLDAPANTTLIDYGGFGLCDTPNSNLTCDGTFMNSYYQDAEDASPNTNNHTHFFSIQRVVSVTAGSYTFYFNARRTNTYNATFWLWGAAKVSVMYFPSSLTMSSPVAENNQPMTQE